ncbi:MAG: 2-oxoglutarate dehydrogenase E1 component, partial [Pseudomonadota bacterium]
MTYFDETAFLQGVGDGFIEQMYQRWLNNPGSVDESWARWFDGLAEDGATVVREARGASWAPRASRVIGDGDIPVPDEGAYAQIASASAPVFAAMAQGAAPPIAGVGFGAEQVKRATQDSIRALMLIRAYRARGHLLADLDPLKLNEPTEHPELDPAQYGFTEADLDRPIFINYVLGMESATLREILAALKRTYCAEIGVEFLHIQDPDQKAWLQERIEGGRNHTDFTENGKRAILERLTAAESFEKFLDKKFTGTKRFGLDGAEAVIPALEQIVKRGGQTGVREIVVGMAHRGRLNVLTNFMGKPFSAVFSEFQGGAASPDDVQ